MTTQLPLKLPFRSAMGADDFMVAPGNAAAVAWIDAWPQWPAPALVVFGPPASGKTHLAHVWQTRSRALNFTAHHLQTEDFLRRLQHTTEVIVDDIDTVIQTPACEQALLHLYNWLKEKNGHILLLASQSPSQWKFHIQDLRSRILAAPAVEILPPDDSLLSIIFVKLFKDRQLKIDEGVISFLLQQCERSFQAARIIVAALDEVALASQRRITIPLARQVLEQLNKDTKI